MYDAINDSRTRPTHRALDNVIRHIDDPFWDTYYPPNGFRCRCSTISLTENQATSRGGVKPPPEDGFPEPDKGWDHNCGKDPDQGIQESSKPDRGDSPELGKGLGRRKPPLEQNEKLSPATRQEVESWLGEVDESLAQAAAEIVEEIYGKGSWPSEMFPIPASLRGVASIGDEFPLLGDAAGVYNEGTHEVLVQSSLSETGKREVLRHELGHHFDTTVLKLQRNSELRRAVVNEYQKVAAKLHDKESLGLVDYANYRNQPILSPHALSSEKDWIAESFRTYVETPRTLELVAPETYRALEKVRLEDL
jgi:hypothetical protein